MSPRLSKNGKRLGRPPKNKQPESSGTVFSVVSPEQSVSPKQQQPVEIDPSSMIECELLAMPQYQSMTNPTNEKRFGLYSNSMYSGVEGLNWCRWVVVGYLRADFQKYRDEGMDDATILQRCVNYLNATEAKKKYAKKDPVPKYGKLQLFNQEIKFTKKFGYECAILLATTDQRRCELFWGEGEKF